MPQTHVMTLEEQTAIGLEALEMKKQGNMEEYHRLTRLMPMPHWLAKFMKDHLGADFLIQGDWNLSEAEAEYGSDWLTQ